MEWFEGNIAEAIQRAKTNRSVFIVFVYGDDDDSRAMTNTWNDASICQLTVSNSCVPIKLEATSQPGRQFSQIYPVMCVPGVFFINASSGVPLEVCGGRLSPAELTEKFQHALQLHRSSASAPSTSPQSGVGQENVATGTSRTAVTDASSSQREATTSQAGAAGTESGESPDECSAGAAAAADDGTEVVEGDSEIVLEEKKERAAALLAERRYKKLMEEKEKQKLEEIERRKLGQEMNKFKNWKDDMVKKEIETSMKKDKDEAKRARERVKEEIERDRQERAARFHNEKTAQESAAQAKRDSKAAAEAELVTKKNAEQRETSRLQFRLPNGSSVTQSFSSTEHLLAVRDFIQQKLNASSVTLICTFPKRTFTDADMSSTLLDLDLVPSAALIVLLSKPGGNGGGGDGGFLSTVLAFFLGVWMFLVGLFYKTPQPVQSAASSEADRQGSIQPASSGVPTPSFAGSPQSGVTWKAPGASVRQRPKASGGSKVRKDDSSNIHRLHDGNDDDDDDDENATWNGNSTQQM